MLGALARRAEEVYSDFTSPQQNAAKQVFLRLVTLGEGVEDTRRRVLQAELEALTIDGGSGAGLVDAVLDAFGKARLLSFDRDPVTRGPTVEVAHEALLREWSRLREWLDESRADLRMQRVLSNAAADWVGNEDDPSFLLRGSRLEQYAGWAEATPLALTETEQAYLNASLADEAERQARRERLERRARNFLRALVVVFALAAIVAAGLSIFAFQQRRASQEQTAVLLAGQAETELANGYHDRAVLLAMTALEEFPYTVQAEHALGQAVSYSRALQVYERHTSAATSVAWSPDGSKVATSSSTENRVDIWNPRTGELLLALDMPTGITGNIFDMALHVQWTPDGEQLLILTGDRYSLGSQDYDLHLVDAANGEIIRSVEIPNQAEPESGELVVTFFPYATGAAAEIAPQSGRLATLGGDNTAIIWDAEWQNPALLLPGHTRGVNSVDWSPDETLLATASLDGTAIIWDVQTGEARHTLVGHEGRLSMAIWSPDGASLATGGEDGNLRLWNASDGELMRVIETQAGEISSLVWAPNSVRIITGHIDGSLRFWEAATGKLLETLRGHEGMVSDLQWSPVDDRLASTDGSGGVRIWNAAFSTAWRLYPPQAERDELWWVQGADWSSDSRYLTMAGGDVVSFTDPPSFAIWDVQQNKLIKENLGDALNLMGLMADFSPDDQAILYLGLKGFPDFSDFATAYVFDANSGEIIRTFTPGGENLIRSVAWSPDGTQVATGLFNGELLIWDYQTSEQIANMFHNDLGINFIEWSPDGSKIASAGGNFAKIWDAYTWDLLVTLDHDDPTSDIGIAAWSPDSKRLLTGGGNDEQGSQDTTGRVWDAETGEELLVFNGHTMSVWPGDWSPDGSRISTFGNEGTVRIWDSSTGDELLTLTVPAVYGGYTWWSPDGQHLAYVGSTR